MLVGSTLYEWLSHNFFVVASIVGAIVVMVYFVYAISRRKGRYRQ